MDGEYVVQYVGTGDCKGMHVTIWGYDRHGRSLDDSQLENFRSFTLYVLYYLILCTGKYLSYEEWGRDPSGRVRFQSADATRPMRWRVVNVESNTFSLEAVRSFSMRIHSTMNYYTISVLRYSQVYRAKCCPAKLSYARSCRSKSVRVRPRGLLSWDLTQVGSRGTIYKVFAKVRLRII